jgi:hypothetical protein
MVRLLQSSAVVSATPSSPRVVEVTRMLGEGPARCDFCHGSYSFEVEVICVDCDRTMCPFCAIRMRAHHSCRDCRPRDESDEGEV